MRNYDLDPAVLHFVAVYTRQGDAWQEIDRMSLDAPALHGTAEGDSISSDYLRQGDVKAVAVGNDTEGLWIEVDGGVGAHSGVFQLLRFDGTTLTMQIASMSSSPGFGRVADINGDGQNEVVMDTSDPYVFCYACGLRHVSFEVWRWDAAAGALDTVGLEPLATTSTEGIGVPVNQAVQWAQAGSLERRPGSDRQPDHRRDHLGRNGRAGYRNPRHHRLEHRHHSPDQRCHAG